MRIQLQFSISVDYDSVDISHALTCPHRLPGTIQFRGEDRRVDRLMDADQIVRVGGDIMHVMH
jgi:hypothetical protein